MTLSPAGARAILRLAKAEDQDFHTLSSAQVDVLIQEADRLRYRKPKNANGSRGRYFHAMLERKAAR